METKGIAASPGIFIGKIFIKKDKELDIEKREVYDHREELKRLKEAREKAKKQLKKVKNSAAEKFGEKKAEIFEAHLMFLDDPELIPNIESKIRDEKINAEAAVQEVVEHYARIFANMDNEYMQAREDDVKDVGKRLIKILLGVEELSEEIEDEAAVVTRELRPSETAQLNNDKVKALVTRGGSRTSHTAIIARSLEIPAVVGVKDDIIDCRYQQGEIIVDGNQGRVIIEPDEKTKEKYKKRLQKYKKEQEKLQTFKEKKAVTKDGTAIEVAGNIGNLADVDAVLEKGGEGIGLFRTEFLYMDREKLPTEEEQFEVYRDVVEKMGDKPVIIRTLDIGGDKDLPYLELKEELNPFLGYRAIRLCLDRPKLFKPQLKAILRAGYYGNVKLMYPMVSSVEEVLKANEVLEECKKELAESNKDFAEQIEVGIMIEVPSAVRIGDFLAREVDFFSIGTNDLIQYAVAVDRTNDDIADMHTPYHPALLRFIKESIEHAHNNDLWIGMCGEAAGDELLLPFLLGAGLDEFSMSAVSILKIKKLLNRWSISEAKKVAEDALRLATAGEVEEYLQRVKK